MKIRIYHTEAFAPAVTLKYCDGNDAVCSSKSDSVMLLDLSKCADAVASSRCTP